MKHIGLSRDADDSDQAPVWRGRL